MSDSSQPAALPMAWRRFAPGLKTSVALSVAILVGCALAFSGWLYARHYGHSFRAGVIAQQATIAERLAAEVGSRIAAHKAQLERFARDVASAGFSNQARLQASLKALAEYQPYLEDFWIVDSGGRILADYPPLPGRLGRSVAQTEHFRRLASTRRFVVAEAAVDRVGGEALVILLAPVSDGAGEFAGAVAGTIRLRSSSFLGEPVGPTTAGAGPSGVVNGAGLILAHRDPARILASEGALNGVASARLGEGVGGAAEGMDAGGASLLYTVRSIAGTDWFVYTTWPLDPWHGQLRQALTHSVGLMAALALAAGVAAWLLMARLLRPLAHLAVEMRHAAAAPDRRAPLPVVEGGEIGELAEGYNRIIQARAETETERAAAYAQMDQTGRMLAVLYERSPLGMALLQSDGRILRCNPAFRRIVGYDQAELEQIREPELTAPEWTAADAAAAASLRADGLVAPYEKEYIARGGMRVPVRVSGVAVTETGVGECAWWLVEDVAARRQMLDALKASEAEARMLAAAASHTGNMVVICDPSCRVEWVNSAFTRTAGYTLDDVKGRVVGHLLQGPDSDPEVVAVMRNALAAREPFAVELVNYAKDGRRYWVNIECAPVFDHLGRIERFVAVERDITDQKQAAQALQESEAKHRGIFETAREVIWRCDADGRLLLLNPAWERLTGHPIAASLGRPLCDFLVDDQRERTRQEFADLVAGRLDEIDGLGALLTRNDGARWFEMRGRVYPGADGQPLCVGTLHDIHDKREAEASRRAAEEALRESQERYARAIEAASDVIWERNLRTGRLFISDRIGAILRVPGGASDASQADVLSRVHADDLALHKRSVEAMCGGDGTVTWEARFATGDGGYRWLRVRGRMVRDAAGAPLLLSGTASDVHDAHVASEELRAMQVRYQRAMDGSNDGVWERDMATDEFYFSDRFDEILGYAPGAMPRALDDWHALLHPDDRAAHEAGVARMLAERTTAMWEARFRTASGAYRWLRLRGVATRDAGGRSIMASGTASDIHHARLAEEELKRHRDNLAQLVEERTAGLELATREAERQREKAEAARAQAERARQEAVRASLAKSDFLANMSHELRTPMHAILSFASFGADKIERVGSDTLLRYFRNIQKSGARLLELLNDLLDLSKLEVGKMQLQPQQVELARLVAESANEVETLARARGIILEVRVDGAPAAQVDEARMLQVLRNLLSNAIKFTPAGGRVDIECVARPGGAEIRVRDDGVGIPEDELEAVFDKFVQSSKTKTGAGGTGLGLAICREIVAAHGGTIQAFNNAPPGRGALFVVRLPAPETARAQQPAIELA